LQLPSAKLHFLNNDVTIATADFEPYILNKSLVGVDDDDDDADAEARMRP